MIFIELSDELDLKSKQRIMEILQSHGLHKIGNYWTISNEQYKVALNQILKEFADINVTNKSRRDIKFISMSSKQPPTKYATVEYVDQKISELKYATIEYIDQKISELKYATIEYINQKIDEVNTKIEKSQRATIAYVDKKINEVNTNVLELLKIGLTPLYKKLDVELPSQFLN